MKDNIKLVGGVEISKDVFERVKTVGVRGLDFEKAKELGLFQRISYSLCAVHAAISAAYRIYADVDYLLSEFRGRKNEIARAMNAFEKAYDKFFSFWTDFYADDKSNEDITRETESLFRSIMRWAQLPLYWQLGDEQRTSGSEEIEVVVECDDDSTINFHRCVVETEQLDEPVETWCVTKYSHVTLEQESVNIGMDKASAMMSAKRLSANDNENFYTASKVFTVTEKRSEVIPFKVFKNGDTVGKQK